MNIDINAVRMLFLNGIRHLEDGFMRTTLNLDHQLLIPAKHRAVEQGVSLSEVIENALRESFSKPDVERKVVRLVTATGIGVKPGVDLDNGRSLLEIMDGPV